MQRHDRWALHHLRTVLTELLTEHFCEESNSIDHHPHAKPPQISGRCGFAAC